MILSLVLFLTLWVIAIVLLVCWFGIHAYYLHDHDKKVSAAARTILSADFGKGDDEIGQLVKDQARIIRESKLPLSWLFLPGR